MTDMVFAPSLADLDAEREVVLEEIAMVDDTPQELIFDLVTQAVFGRHPLGRPVLGSADVISSVSRRSLGAFHRRRYRPDNVVVATAGSVVHARLVKLIGDEAMFAHRDPVCVATTVAELVAAAEDHPILRGARGGIAVSTDGGRSWRAAALAPACGEPIWSIAVSADAPAVMSPPELASGPQPTEPSSPIERMTSP